MSSQSLSQEQITILQLFKKQFPWKNDYDDRSRPCSVTLYERVIGGSGVATHWVLNFNWGDREATYEANDSNGFLIPTWNEGSPDLSYSWSSTETNATNCSPMEVNIKAKDVEISGCVYMLINVNCREWAIMLAKSLDIELSKALALEKFLPPFVDYAINIAHAFYKVSNFFQEGSSSGNMSSSSFSSFGSSTKR